MKSFIISIFICLHCSLVMGNSLSDTADDYLTSGIELFKSGQFNKSYERLLKAFENFPENQELNFYLGRAAFETKNYEMAIMAFERILIASPFEHRVKLEIARAFQRLGANNTARQYCNEVLATNPPEAVKNNIKKFLIYIDKTEQKHFLSGQVVTGIDWNNNVWASPSTGTIKTIIGNVDLTGASSKKTRDWIYNTTIGIDHTYRFPYSSYSWKTQASFYKAIYDKINSLDICYIGGQTGPEFVSGKNKFGFRLLSNQIEIGNTQYQRSVGLKAVLDHTIKPLLVISTVFKYEAKDFPGSPERDSENKSISIDMGLGFKNNWLSLSLGMEHEDAFDDEYSYNRFISNLSITRELPLKTIGSINYNYHYSYYDDPAALFDKNREDHQHSAGCSLEKKIWKSLIKPNQNISIRLNYLHTFAYSNIALYEFDKDLFQLLLIYNF